MSRHSISLWLFVAIMLMGSYPGTAAEGPLRPLTIVVNPGPFASIEEATTSEGRVDFFDGDERDDTACTESFAATELRRFLARCLDRPVESIQLAGPESMPEKGDVLLLGTRTSNPLIASAHPTPGSQSLPSVVGAYQLRSKADGDRTFITIEGAERIGTLYGAYAFLEQLGMRFYGLGEAGTLYPAEACQLPRELDVTESPQFLTRGYYVSDPRGNEPFFLWMARNRANLWTATEANIGLLKKLGIRLSAGGHGVQAKFLSPLTYAEKHPEWYALRGGKRQARPQKDLSANYCTSNAEATAKLAKNLVQGLIDGDYRHADFIDLWMLDHRPWCECKPCQEQGTPTDRLLWLQYRTSQEIQAARRDGRLKRDVQLNSLAYLETLEPPTRPLPADFDYASCFVTFFPISRCYAHALASPACREINEATCKCYEAWTQGGHYQGSLCIGEYYNVSSLKSLPVLHTRNMSADIPWYHRHGARHLNYMHVPTSLWGTWTWNNYLLARLLWDPDADVDALLEEYLRRCYPTTTQHMRGFFAHLQQATANIKAFKHHVWTGSTYHCLIGKLNEEAEELFPLRHLGYAPASSAVNDAPSIVEMIESMARARREIDDALLECRDPAERTRLLEDEHRFAYGEAMYLFIYHLVRVRLFDQRGEEELARHEFAALDRQAERLRAMVDVVQVAHRHANARDGLEATQAEPSYKRYLERYGKALQP
jgi:hypothetical protein